MKKKVFTRRDLRILALWAIFSEEVGQASPSETIKEFAPEILGREYPGNIEDESLSYAKKLISAVDDHLGEIDHVINKRSKAWPINRMPRVDLSILRLALAETVYLGEVPLEVAINEALELSREFGAHASPRFVNGVLMGALEELGYAAKGQKKEEDFW